MVRHPVTFDPSDIRAGRVIDIQVNDPAFDATFIVEGAPSDLVRALLDEPLRRALLEIQHVSV